MALVERWAPAGACATAEGHVESPSCGSMMNGDYGAAGLFLVSTINLIKWPSTGPTSSAVHMRESKAGELGRDGAFMQMQTRRRLESNDNGIVF